MKIIEAMKRIKVLDAEIDDLTNKIRNNSAHREDEPSEYEDPRAKVSEWVMGCRSRIKEMTRLKLAIQKTNLATNVSIKLGDNMITESIAYWIHRRMHMANKEAHVFRQLTNRGLQARGIQGPDKMEIIPVHLNYDPEFRDKELAVLNNEAQEINSTLEVVNATTDLIE